MSLAGVSSVGVPKQAAAIDVCKVVPGKVVRAVPGVGSLCTVTLPKPGRDRLTSSAPGRTAPRSPRGERPGQVRRPPSR